jgi:hypothetical protein
MKFRLKTGFGQVRQIQEKIDFDFQQGENYQLFKKQLLGGF